MPLSTPTEIPLIEKIDRALRGGDLSGLCDRDIRDRVRIALKPRFPLRIGSVSEPFTRPLEDEHRHTKKVIEKFGGNRYPYLLCTKNPLVSSPEYIRLIGSTHGAVQVSLISIDDILLVHIEPNSPGASQRLEAIRRLAENGIWTACRIQPLIPRVTEQGMRDLIFRLAELGTNHVTVEFLKFPQVHQTGMSARLKQALDKYQKQGNTLPEELGFFGNDLLAFYKNFDDTLSIGGYRFFSLREKARLMPLFVAMVKEANKEYGAEMTFGSGDEETSYLNQTENCCGVDMINGYGGYSTTTVQTMLRIAKSRGRVTLEDMKPFYSPFPQKFLEYWNMKSRSGYFVEKRVFRLRAETNADLDTVEYVYDENNVPEQLRKP